MSQEKKMGLLDFLSPINAAVTALKNLVDLYNNSQDRADRENTSMAVDLTDLLYELSKTHAAIVKLASPLRRIKNDPQTFATDFKAVYADFRDNYDAKDFVEERTHCHKIGQIHSRIQRRKPKFGSQAQWNALNRILYQLDSSDVDIIKKQYIPFMKRFDETMRRIEQHVENNQITEAIAEKDAFLDSLDPDYDKNKAMLEEMTDRVGKLTANL